jgi:hypothetical protein
MPVPRSVDALKENGSLPIRRVSSMASIIRKITVSDLYPRGLLDLFRQGTTWVALVRQGDGKLADVPMPSAVVSRRAALEFLDKALNGKKQL